jgi:hypothetical protein
MYGIIMTAVITGVVGIQIIKLKNIKDIDGLPLSPIKKKRQREIFNRRDAVWTGLGFSRRLDPSIF